LIKRLETRIVVVDQAIERGVTGAESQLNVVSVLSPERAKDLAHDYLKREIEAETGISATGKGFDR
jgi:hypothetical protein